MTADGKRTVVMNAAFHKEDTLHWMSLLVILHHVVFVALHRAHVAHHSVKLNLEINAETITGVEMPVFVMAEDHNAHLQLTNLTKLYATRSLCASWGNALGLSVLHMV